MWAVAIAAVVVAGFVLAKVGRFLRMGGSFLALVALAVGGWYWHRTRNDERTTAARQRIPVSSVEMVDAKLAPLATGAGRYSLVGRVRNKSRTDTLSTVTVAVTVKDCAGRTCETLAQQTERIPVTIPPGQSRDIRDDVLLTPAPVTKGKFSWSHKIVSAESRGAGG